MRDGSTFLRIAAAVQPLVVYSHISPNLEVMNSGFYPMRLEFTRLITQNSLMRLDLRSSRVLAVLMLALFAFAGFAPAYALTGLGVNPTSVATGGTVTITITYTVNTGDDIYHFLTVTDPVGNMWNYTGTPFTMHPTSSPKVITFPDAGKWTLVQNGTGPNVNGTDVSGIYHVTGTYIDAGLSLKFKMIFSVTSNGNFKVPEFNQSILLLVGLMIPALLLARQKAAKSPI